MSKSNYLETQIIDHIFRTATFAKPTILAVSLYTSDPTEADIGTEVTGGSYARVDLPPLNTNWDAPTDGATANTLIVTFPVPSANWGLITHFAIRDAMTVGNMLYHAPLTASKTVNNGDPAPSFPIGDIDVTES